MPVMSPSLFVYSVFSLLFFSWSIFLFYWLPILEHLGFGLTQAGQLISVGLITRGLAAYFLYPYCVGRWGVMWVDRRMYLCLAIATIALGAPLPLMVKACLSVFISTLLPIGIPLSETLGSSAQKHKGTDYELARIFGSSSFILCTLMTSVLSDAFGFGAALWFLVAILFLMLAVFIKAVPIETSGPAERVGTMPKHYWGYLGIAAILQAAHAVYYAFGIKTFLGYGFSTIQASLLVAVGVVAEVIFYIGCKKIGRLNVFLLITLGSIGSVVRWAIYAECTSTVMLILAGLMHALSFSASHLGFIYYVNRRLPENLWPKAFGVYTAVCMSFATGALTALIAPVYEQSIPTSFWVMSGLCALAVVGCLWVYQDHRRNTP